MVKSWLISHSCRETNEGKEFIAVYLFRPEGLITANRSIRAEYTIRFRREKAGAKDKHIAEQTAKDRFTAKSVLGWGWRSFAKHKDLEENEAYRFEIDLSYCVEDEREEVFSSTVVWDEV